MNAWVVASNCSVGMAWEARSGLKRFFAVHLTVLNEWCRNGLGSPFGIETREGMSPPWQVIRAGMAWDARSGLKQRKLHLIDDLAIRRNGLGSPFGIET